MLPRLRRFDPSINLSVEVRSQRAAYDVSFNEESELAVTKRHNAFRGERMLNPYRKFLALVAIGATYFAIASTGGTDITISGWVIDSACAYTKGLDKPIGVACAKACAKNGSPLVILRDDGTIFLPIDSKTPSASQNSKLMPFAGEHVTVTGKDYVRNASHALVIDKISK
jgi:hypothetical protein